MSYTIAVFEPVHDTVKLHIEKSGLQFIVTLYNTETQESTCKRFENLVDAYKVFEVLMRWYVFGVYSDKRKRQYLKTGTMD